VKKIPLAAHESIVAVTCEPAMGPGWSNTPTWVHIVDHATGTYRKECIQPTERTPALHELYGIGVAVHQALIAAVPTTKARKKREAQS